MSTVWKSPRGVFTRKTRTCSPATYSGAPKIFVIRLPTMPPTSPTTISPATSPLSARVTASVVSVQIRPPRSTGRELMTVASTMNGDFATSCSSVGRTIVVACAATAAIIKTHAYQYTRK